MMINVKAGQRNGIENKEIGGWVDNNNKVIFFLYEFLQFKVDKHF